MKKTRSHSVRTLATATLALFAAQVGWTQTTWFWTGANHTTDTNWSDAGNWLDFATGTTAGTPAPGDNVIFSSTNDPAAPFLVGNTLMETNTVDGNFLTVNSSAAINSLFYGFAPINTTGFYTNGLYTNAAFITYLSPGVTLTINGTANADPGNTHNSDILFAGTGSDWGTNWSVSARILGPGAALLVSNVFATVNVYQGSGAGAATFPSPSLDQQQRATLDLSELDTFIALSHHFFVGVQGSVSGGANTATTPGKQNGTLYLAKTNFITLTADGLFLIGESASDGSQVGSRLYLGQTNVIFANTIATSRKKGGYGNLMTFNPALAGQNPVAYFRGADGVSPVTTWVIGDDAAANSGVNPSFGTNDFSGGIVDARVDTMVVGRGQNATSRAAGGAGTLTFDAGQIVVNNLTNGTQGAANASSSGMGTINVNGTGVLTVNNVLFLGNVLGGAGAAGTWGILNINGGTVQANVITNQGSHAIITLSGGALISTNAPFSTAASPLSTLAMTNSTLTLGAFLGAASVVVTNFIAEGANTINIASLPVIANYPATIRLVQYTSSSGTFNFNLGTLPAATPSYHGYLTNNAGTALLNLVLTNGPHTAQLLTWSGQAGNGDWDTFTGNWKTNGVPGAVYNDPDFVTFDDTAISNIVNLTGIFQPSAVVISNETLNYTWVGGGGLSGPFALDKQGAGSLTVANIGNNDFTGGFTIESGMVQMGNGDASGSLGAGPILNNGSLVDDRSGDHEIAGLISGSGSLTKMTNGVLTLSGANTFTGPLTVLAGTLRANNASALGATNGATTIANGATLDLNGQNLGAEQVIVGGAGVVSFGLTNGAIENSSGNQLQALRYVTLTTNTVLRADARWDIRGPAAALLASPPGSAYNMLKVGGAQFSLVSVTNVDAGLGDIDVAEGIFSIQDTTAQLGNVLGNLIVRSAATLDLSNLNAHPLNKVITLEGNTTIQVENGSSIVAGPVTLQGATSLYTYTPGASLSFNNAISGVGGLNVQGLGTVVLAGGVNTFTGGIVNYQGRLVLNCVNQGSLTSYDVLAGNGTNYGPVECDAPFRPGNDGVAGTFAVGDNMTLNGDVAFDLNPTNTTGGGVNDFLDVATNLTLNYNTISINPLHGTLQAGTYRLVHYGGSLTGAFSGDPAPFGLYTFTLDYSETNWIKLNVAAGTASSLTWSGTTDPSWEGQNWSNQLTSANVAFSQGDFVTFDDSVPGVQTNITLNSVVFPSGITNNANTNNFTISGSGVISGMGGLVKMGTNTLTVGTSNNFSGPVVVRAGILRLAQTAAANFALGATNVPAIITNGGTLDLNGFGGGAGTRTLDGKTLIISGAGFNGQGAIINSSGGRSDNAVANVTLAGDATLAANGTAGGFSWNIRNLGNGSTLSTGGNPFNLTILGPARLSLFSVNVDPALADIDVQGGVFDLGDYTSSLGNPTNTLTVEAGATLSFYANNPPGVTTNLWNKVFILHGNGTNNTVQNRGGGAHTLIGPVQLFGDVIFSGSLTNRGNITGPGNLIRLGGGTLFLAGTNTYAGNTTVSAGTLALVDSGVISNQAAITINSGATLDVSSRVDGTLTLGNGQMLQGSGTLTGNLMAGVGSTVTPGASLSRLTISSNVTLNGTTQIEIDKSNLATNDQLFAGGAITYGGTLVLTNLGPAYAAGDAFKIFNGGSYTGSFTLQPAAPAPGLTWDTSLLNSSGVLQVVSAGPSQPSIAAISLSGTTLAISATNGSPGGGWTLLQSTNLALPLSQWETNLTGTFDGGGNLSTNIANTVTNDLEFYILKQ